MSEAVLDAVARALRLEDDERGHLFDLARSRRPERVPRVRPEVHQMLDILGGVSPAFVVNHRQDVPAATHLARALTTDCDGLPYRERNFARYVLLDPAAHELYTHWDEVAQVVVAHPRPRQLRTPRPLLKGEPCIRSTSTATRAGSASPSPSSSPGRSCTSSSS
ncbi:hypothetical protein [Streptomyces viridochromogenes]|uniref:MmyB family transcriptional regulator n=1 Tax=Streptomyces viridochromogenes TaxID=1938 RepID=UPI000694E022